LLGLQVGVRNVENEIRVATATSAADLKSDVDAAIRRRFRRDVQRIGIATADGVVTLSGVVDTFAVLEELERTVQSIPGVTRIDNQLLVA
jgi:osmotically-inducible protein OsmY